MSDTPLPLPGSQPASPGSGQASAKEASAPVAPGAASNTPAPGAVIQYDDFAKVQLRVATVLEAAPAPTGDKLLVLQVDLGDEKRQILAGIRQHVTADSLVGKQIVIVANLAPRQMRGLTSQGMLLAATDASGKVVLVSPTDPVAAGSKVS